MVNVTCDDPAYPTLEKPRELARTSVFIDCHGDQQMEPQTMARPPSPQTAELRDRLVAMSNDELSNMRQLDFAAMLGLSKQICSREVKAERERRGLSQKKELIDDLIWTCEMAHRAKAVVPIVRKLVGEYGSWTKLIRRLSKIGDYYSPYSRKSIRKRREPGRIDIWCGDCVELMDKIEAKTVSTVTTSCPYNVGTKYGSYSDNRTEEDYLQWLAIVFDQIERVLRDDGSLFLIVGNTPSKPWVAMKVAEIAGQHFALQNQIVWAKSIAMEGRTHGHYKPIQGNHFLNHNWESVFHFSKRGDVKLDRLAIGVPYVDEANQKRKQNIDPLHCSGDVWFVPYPTTSSKKEDTGHPAAFPPELAERCLKLHGIEADSFVLDPFCGINGMVAAARLGLNGIGIDLDPEYCEEAQKRVGQEQQDANKYDDDDYVFHGRRLPPL